MLESLDELRTRVSARATEEIYREIGAIASQFKLYECVEGARAVLEWLKENETKGTLLKLKTKHKERFIVSLRLERLGITDSIAQNGVHYGVEVHGRVFDNLSSRGLSREEWLSDFCCRGDEFILEELEDFQEAV